MAEAPEICRAFRNKGNCRYGDECKYEHTEGDVIAPPPRGECYNWKETGECEFGERCRFTHGDDDVRYDADGQRISSGEKTGSRRRRRRRRDNEPREKLDEICNNYQEGRCRYGDNCRRQHVGDVPVKPVEKIDEVCNNFLAGRCRFGDLCRRQHVEQE